MLIASYDPGVNGACCVVHYSHNSGMMVEDCIDLPTAEDGQNRQVDVPALVEWLSIWKIDEAVIENVQPMPSIPGKDGLRRPMGAASSFRFGMACGQIRGTMAALGARIVLVHPQSWKRHFELSGPNKENSRQKAIELISGSDEFLARKKDHQRAEAMLLALYRCDKLPPPDMFPEG